MTHIFEVPTNSYNLIKSGEQNFDILRLGPRVQLGDTVIYQRLADGDDEEDSDEELNETSVSGDEIAVSIKLLFDDSDNALKKGFTLFGFEIKD
jgi:hypothetical protein